MAGKAGKNGTSPARQMKTKPRRLAGSSKPQVSRLMLV